MKPTHKINLFSLYRLYRKIKKLIKKWRLEHPNNDDLSNENN